MRLLVDLEPRHPARGLAIDEALLETVRHGREGATRVWASETAVIIGRSQSAASECTELVRRLAIPVLRRISGGGAVVHYPGNLNVSVAARADEVGPAESAFERFVAGLAAGLERLGVAARAEERLVSVCGDKVSGAAQARRGAGVLVHGTVLVAPAPMALEALLLAMQPQYAPRGTASRARPTVTLTEALGRGVDPAEAADAALRGLASVLGWAWTPGELTREELQRADDLEAARYRRREWNESR